MGLADRERAALADLFDEVGPDRPTLCAGWATGDLLVHLLIRERRPDAALGLLLPPLQAHSATVGAQLRRHSWPQQVGWLRGGPPLWNPMGWGPLAELANGAEFFIHHEDVRRGTAGWEPRALDPASAGAVASLVGSGFMKFRFRASPVGITAVMPGREPVVLHAAAPTVEIHGDPAEVLLWAAGRAAARVSRHGDPAAVRAADTLSRRM